MADRVSASITLGGTISPFAYTELADIIAAEGLSTEWDGEPFETDHRTEGEPLRLFAHEVGLRNLRPGASSTACRSRAGPALMAANGVPSASCSPVAESRRPMPPMRMTAL